MTDYTQDDDRVVALAAKTKDAEPYIMYGEEQWRACIVLLLNRGFSQGEIELILRSGWMKSAPVSQFFDTFGGSHPVLIRRR